MKFNGLPLSLAMGMMAAMAIVTSPVEVNAQTTTERVCVQRNRFEQCVRYKVIKVNNVLVVPQRQRQPQPQPSSSSSSSQSSSSLSGQR